MKTDILGRELSVGDFVTCDTYVFKIIKFTPKMVSVQYAKSSGSKLIHKYGRELTLVPESDVLMWLLKQPAKK